MRTHDTRVHVVYLRTYIVYCFEIHILIGPALESSENSSDFGAYGRHTKSVHSPVVSCSTHATTCRSICKDISYVKKNGYWNSDASHGTAHLGCVRINTVRWNRAGFIYVWDPSKILRAHMFRGCYNDFRPLRIIYIVVASLQSALITVVTVEWRSILIYIYNTFLMVFEVHRGKR